MVQIIPAVLATTEEEYQQDISKLESCESLQNGWVHIDFADNIFVQNITIEPEIIQKSPTNLLKEAHLMVAHPREWIDKLVAAGFNRVIFHIECEDNIEEVIDYIKSKGLEVGLAIKNETPIEKLQPFVGRINRGTVFVPKIEVILVMTIVPGFQGQPFIPQALDKVRQIKSKWGVKVGVDGAVKDDNIKDIVDTGADFVIIGSYLLKGNIEENLENLWEIING